MKCRILIPLLTAAMLLIAAFSTGNPMFLTGAILILLVILSGLISVFSAASTLTVSAALSENTVHRGDHALLEISVRHRSIFPIAPVTVELISAPGTEPREIRLKDCPGKQQRLSLPFYAAHIGVTDAGVRSCSVEDLLGLFTKKLKTPETRFEFTVLPTTFSVKPLIMSPGDPGSEMMARATEDVSAPSDVRQYQAGDAMKKIHWKLSLRKGDLLVRKFDEPLLKEALILMDCSRPPSWGHSEAENDIKDALLETSASLIESLCNTDNTFRMPLFGSHPIDLSKETGFVHAVETLARLDFSETDRFERLLIMESHHLRKTGCVAVVSARLNSAMVDVMIRMHAIGPNMNMFLITFAPDDPHVQTLIAKLRQNGIPVDFITPVSA